MSNVRWSLVAGATVGLMACWSPSGPDGGRREVAVRPISVSAHAAPGDTIRVTYDLDTSPCDRDIVVQSAVLDQAIRLSASAVTGRCTIPVGSYIHATWTSDFVPYASPYTLRFARPGRADSVIVVPR